MARKNLLAGLIAPQADQSSEAALPPRPVELFGAGAPGGARGAIGAVSRSIEQLKSQTIVELPVDQIDPSFVSDRLDGGAASQSELTALIQEHGQQVPILVRPHPQEEGRYQVVYGHRRLRAAATLGRPVKAVVRRLSDDELVVAQGQENSARADLTYIERALFATALEERGFERSIIMAALSVDKFGLSKLIGSATKIPRDIISAVGPAPGVGRDKWQALAAVLEASGAIEKARALCETLGSSGKPSEERFRHLMQGLEPRPEPRAATEEPTFTAPSGRKVAVLRNASSHSNVRIDKRASPGFGEFLFERLPELYAAYEKAAKGK